MFGGFNVQKIQIVGSAPEPQGSDTTVAHVERLQRDPFSRAHITARESDSTCH
jgi:hypothetical protein